MNDKTREVRGRQISMGVFAFVVVVLCITAIFGTGIHFGAGDVEQTFGPVSAASRLADTLIELDLDPELSDAELDRMLQMVLDRAAAGEVEAVSFVFTLASRQRAEHEEAHEHAVESPGSKGGPR